MINSNERPMIKNNDRPMIRSLRVRAVRSSTTKTHPTSTVVSVRQTSLSECAVSATTRTQEAYTHLLKPHHTRTFCVHLSSLLISYITKCTKTQNTKQLQKHIQHTHLLCSLDRFALQEAPRPKTPSSLKNVSNT